MKIASIIGLVIVLISAGWFFTNLPGYSNQSLAIILFLILAIPISVYLWIKG